MAGQEREIFLEAAARSDQMKCVLTLGKKKKNGGISLGSNNKSLGQFKANVLNWWPVNILIFALFDCEK